MPKAPQSLDQLTQDDKNANKGTKRGRSVLRESLEKYGAGRSLLADKNGKLIAGNKTHAEATDYGFKAKIVDIAPDEILVARRPDLDLDDPNDSRARELAYYDNMAGFLDLAWDQNRVMADAQQLDLGGLWEPAEFRKMFEGMAPAVEYQAPGASVAPAQAPAASYDPDSEEYEGAPAAPAVASYARMKQLFFNGEQYDQAQGILDRIKADTGAVNDTDATLFALQYWAANRGDDAPH